MNFFLHIPKPWCKIMKITLGQVFIAILLTGLSYAKTSKAQAMLNKNVTVAINNSSLSRALKQLEKYADVKFVYSKSIIQTNQDVSVNAKDEQLSSILNRLLIPNGINYQVVNNRIILTKGAEPLISPVEVSNVTIPDKPAIATTVTGNVTDENNQPLPGVTIRLNSTGRGTTTDVNGAFKIDVDKATDTLTFSFIGYQTQKAVIGTSKSFNIKLLPSQENTLKEVQVIGYGTSSRANLATAVSTVKGSAINERPTTTNVLQGLAGKVAGVNIMINSGRPGGSPAIRIRGNGSINTSNDPLYVVDGAAGVDFSSIDPSIIESVTILKDAASAAIYGARGANGVVLITTKKGKDGASTITFNNTLSFGSLQHEVDLMDASQELEMIKRQYAFVGKSAPNLDPANTFARKADLFNSDGTPKYNTDWQKAATHTAVSDNHSLSFSGGKDGLTVLANVAFRNQQGIIKSTYSKQLTGFISLGWDVKPWLHLDAQLNSGAQQGNNEYSNVFGFTPLREMYEMASFLPVNYPDGTPSMKGDFPNLEQSENPVTLENGIKTIAGKSFSQANFTGTIHLSHKLDFVTKFTGSTENDYSMYYEDNNLFPDANTGGDAKRGNTLIGSWTNENYFSYKNDFGKHHVELIGGASWYYTATTYTNAESTGFFDNFYSFNNLSVGAVTLPTLSGYTLKTLNSYYGRANYNYDKRFLFGASLRSDGASNFGLNKKYGVFPSFSAGWNISNEKFFESISKSISLLKIRGSYGIVGNEELPPYISLPKLVNGKTVFSNGTTTEVALSSIAPNPNLHWEKAKQLDIGLELGLFHDRIQFTADYYNKVNSDLLYLLPLPPSSGDQNIYSNIGDIRNRGIELSLNTVNIHNQDFTWSSNVNFSSNRSLVTKLTGSPIYPFAGIIEQGQPLNEFYGYIRENAFATTAEAQKYYSKNPAAVAGSVRYKDVNGNGVKDLGDRVPLGNAMPKFELNMTQTFTYKSLSLFIDVESMYGFKLDNNTKHQMEAAGPNVNSYTEMLNAWTPQNTNTVIPILAPYGGGIPVEVGDSHFIEDGSFIRIRNIGLSYKVNPNWIKRALISNLTIGANVENAFLFTKYSGFDPEYTSFDAKQNQGVDNYQYPKPRTISINLTATF